MSIPEGYHGQVEPENTLARVGLKVYGGDVDSEYHDEVRIPIGNQNRKQEIKIFEGDKIAQVIFKSNAKERVHAILPTSKVITDHRRKDNSGTKHVYRLGKNLTPEQEKEVRDLLDGFEDVMAVDFEEIGAKDVQHKHDIDTGDTTPIKQRPYRTPQKYREWVRQEIDRMLENGIIQPLK